MLETVSKELLAYQMDRLDSYRELNQAVKPGGIIFAGDSLIEFFPIKKFLGRDLPIHNRGIAGIDSKWLLTHLDQQICDLEPSKVFILIGTNDIGLGATNSEIKEMVAEIVAEIKRKSSETQIYLLSILPVSDATQYQKTVKVRNNETIDQLNSALQTLTGIEFIDLSSSLKNANNALDLQLTKDGLHLNLEGYEKVAKVLLPYL
ncbi:SGNH/GDSL hydrolase family protein [Streptococcus porcinus]|uniref:GDSL-like Lipase/acylhydrolase family protein n=2 Tax=Streptococcus porcinus TaxID=1340 RepID=A0A4V0H870_STRPO|nr:SGNH/GDSL hydrolase family protein [Streptococcus porcinus]EGJ26839.1 GDSL-like protein [Streptococcus porcinus str. Jelinkova 176]SQG44286.1 GDSL-like Lipase/acylhydrolase family protein [Streptococcus porcinus]VTT43917.1 GDSL-like Lipase/acylhydrolase family protein [Streptococcus porcinus]VTT45297.1 GDSL-like Lipase/acylhydrolase family protein [Streptococcus porcinus]